MARQSVLIATADSNYLQRELNAVLSVDADNHPDDNRTIESVSLTSYTDTSGDYPHHMTTAAIVVRYDRKWSAQ